MSKCYIVKYYGGQYDSYYEVIIFATLNQKTAIKYINKFNGILKKYKDYYTQFEKKEHGYQWIRDEYIDKYYTRLSSLRDVTKCYYEEVEVR